MSSTEQATPIESDSASQRLGRPILTTLGAIAQSLAIGPIFSSAFVVYASKPHAWEVDETATLAE